MCGWLVRAHLQIDFSAIEAPLAHRHLFPFKIIWEEIFCTLGDSYLPVTVDEDEAGIGKKQGKAHFVVQMH